MALTPENHTVALAKEFAEAFSVCVSEGYAISLGEENGARKTVPSPFGAIACRCGEIMQPIAQFWHRGRLWRYDFCLDCDDCHWDGKLRSVPASKQMPEGTMVAGTQEFVHVKSRYLAEIGSEDWDEAISTSHLIEIMNTDPQNEEDLFMALAEIFECRNGGRGSNIRNAIASRLGGHATWIQSPKEPVCRQCEKTMPLLAQLGPDTCFHWGDLGVAYLFACPQHPDETFTVEQMF